MIELGKHTEKGVISPYQKPRLEFKQETEVKGVQCPH